MNKKTIIIVAIAIIVVAGAYFGYNRWREQRLANQILQEMYGINTGGLLGGITGGGNMSGEIAKEIAKQEAKDEAEQKKEEADEASKTPEDKYNEADVMQTYDASSKALADEGMAIVEAAFGKAKMTAISTAYGVGGEGSGTMSFIIARATTGNDLSALNKVFTDKGLMILSSGVDNKSAMVMAGNYDSASYIIGFEIGEQEVGMTISRNATTE